MLNEKSLHKYIGLSHLPFCEKLDMIDLTPKYIFNYSFRSNGICEYSEYIGKKSYSRSSVPGLFTHITDPKPISPNLANSSAKGIMTAGATKRIKKCLELWFNSISAVKKSSFYEQLRTKYHLTFVTLTLPCLQRHDDKFVKRYIFWPWLEVIQRYYGVKNYIWRAEKQANGNIHFHILIDKFIKHELVRHHWNHHCNAHGYIEAYSNNRYEQYNWEKIFLKYFVPSAKVSNALLRIDNVFKSISSNSLLPPPALRYLQSFVKYLKNQSNEKTFQNISDRLLRDYHDGFKNPNSTDIHNPRLIRNLVSYVCKYMSKKSDKKRYNKDTGLTEIIAETPILGRCWGRSSDLGKLQYFSTSEDEITKIMLSEIRKKNIAKIFDDKFFSFFKFPVYTKLKDLCLSLYNQLHTHFCDIFNYLYNKAGPAPALIFQAT